MVVVLKSEKRNGHRQIEHRCRRESWTQLILNRLIHLSDYLRFAAACKPWFSAAAHQKDRRRREPLKQVVPFLLIPSPDRSPEAREAEDERRRLYSVTQRKVLNTELLRVPYPRRSCGSSHGWLANLEVAEDLSITLQNPFSGETLRFPRVNTRGSIASPAWRRYEFDVAKVVLSCDPCSSPNDFVVLAIYGLTKSLAYIKPGEEDWTYVWGFDFFEDAMYHRGKFYVVDIDSRVFSLDVRESNDQVNRGSSSAGGGNNDQQIIKKVEVTSLGDDTLLFLGHNLLSLRVGFTFPWMPGKLRLLY
ncbi:uncharacterized protein LOC131332584 [Rhododendron vialii]|uniref:uncharacterized protein LOC131332584 n=1 Tax=Rhododendron vialii TaxID=182163 RepID=UPI00265D9777|nr:uncharacterized protein LOC131332584 [Rhododendron vialii]